MVAIQIEPIIRFANKPGKILVILLLLTERRCIRKKETTKDKLIRTISHEKMIHRGAKFWKYLFGIFNSFYILINIIYTGITLISY